MASGANIPWLSGDAGGEGVSLSLCGPGPEDEWMNEKEGQEEKVSDGALSVHSRMILP